MKTLMDFFEELDEMVYVADVETYELVYMNRHLREALGCHSHEEYVGKKCYDLLQGASENCPFCTNPILEPGKFVSWNQQNPILNRSILIKETVYIHEGRKYRIGIGIDTNSDTSCPTTYYYVRSESILNECLQRFFSTVDPEESLNLLLAYLGRTFRCDRVYVFEVDGEGMAHNTYEWCEEGVPSHKKRMKNIPVSDISCLLDRFRDKNEIIVENVEELRDQCEKGYRFLNAQNVRSFAAGAIHIGEKLGGFLGADNPDKKMLPLVTPVLNVLGYFMAAQLRRRDLFLRLNELSFHDTLTGAFNRNAMFEYVASAPQLDSAGVIYCDVTGLKLVNDSMGHDAGDNMLRRCYGLISDVLNTEWIYRTGGDEFVAIYCNISRKELEQEADNLRAGIEQAGEHIAIGYAWSDQQPAALEPLITLADKMMYQDKEHFYANNCSLRRDAQGGVSPACARLDRETSMFNRFAAVTYYDIKAFFDSISQGNETSYFYFGDMQKNLFYISDNMRDEFGFQSNVVPGLVQEWSKRICSEKSRSLYNQEFRNMYASHETVHDLRYQVRNAAGKNMWVHCYGIMKWNEEKTKPLFFSGRISHQDDSFLVDPITNFPKEPVALSYLSELQEGEQSCLVIGFSLNNITEINSTRGRNYSDHLIGSICARLSEKLSQKISFYRMEGMRFAAVVDPDNREEKQELVEQIRTVIRSGYTELGIAVQNPCSFSLIRFPQENLEPEDFMEHLSALIKVAKNDPTQPFIDNSDANIERIQEMCNMALALSRDVLGGMENFRAVIQPVVSTETGKVLGGETLMRWKFNGRDVSPGIFIPILEKEGMISVAGKWVFAQAVRACQRMIKKLPDFYLTVNVSLYQLSDPTFVDFVKETMTTCKLDGRHLIVEMTESCMDQEPEKLVRFVDECGSFGIRVALDDFGTGYSSLRVLLQYPSSMIKLDRSLLLEMTTSAEKMKFISSLVYACHRFGKKVCMEGVETDVQNNLVKRCGCDMIQGFYYYRPMELDDVAALLDSERAD